MLLKGKRCLVTGGGSGIGRAAAARFAEEGGLVTILGHQRKMIDQAAAEMGVRGAVCDIRDAAGLENVVTEMGGVDVAVVNAAICVSIDLLNDRVEKWRDLFETNFWGSVHTCRAVGQAMARQGGGHIVIVSSILARMVENGSGVYAMTKAALSQLTRQLAVEWADKGIFVNAVAPGCVLTPMSFYAGNNEYESEWFRKFFLDPERPRIPILRPGTPEEIAEAILFFANPRNSYCIGQVLEVDGGVTLKF